MKTTTLCIVVCVSLATIFIPACTSLSQSVGNDDGVFGGVGNPFAFPPGGGIAENYQYRTLTVPAALMSCNSGEPDADIALFITNNPDWYEIIEV